MANPAKRSALIFGSSLRVPVFALALCALVMIAMQPAQAQTFMVLHTFTGGGDGGEPRAGLTMDRAGNFYGTTYAGGHTGGACGAGGCGTVFKLSHQGTGWVLFPLYTFLGNDTNDGAAPWGRVIFGPDGNLYGTTTAGGGLGCGGTSPGCGTVYKLQPPASACHTSLCPWTETVIHRFSQLGGVSAGAYPVGEVVFDQSGNLYGTTNGGGTRGAGTVYELTPSNGTWAAQVLHSFDYSDGENPYDGLTFDAQGNLYGTASGAAFQLAHSGSGWVENVLYSFQTIVSYAGVIFDSSGNLYGGTTWDSGYTGGAAYELSPSGSGWIENTLYSFPSDGNGGVGPAASLVFDAAANLYGTTFADPGSGCSGGYGCGTVFKLSPNPDGTWTNTFLYQFTGGTDGANPYSNVTFGLDSNLYGTASAAGGSGCESGCGVVWQITP